MEIELTRVLFIKQRTTKTFILKEGLEIMYYGKDYEWGEKPEVGEVRVEDGIYSIHWEDGQTSTEINDSQQSRDVLKFCGY